MIYNVTDLGWAENLFKYYDHSKKADMRNVLLIPTFALLIFLLLGCSNGYGKPVLPDEKPDVITLQEWNSSGRVLWGLFNLYFDEEKLETTIGPNRNAQLHFNITPLFQPPICYDCVTILLNSFDPVTRILDVDLTLMNPYPIDGYDVRTIVYTNDDGPVLINADDWTALYDIPGGYNINPFKAYAKNEAWRRFAGEADHTENFRILVPDPPMWPAVLFAIDCSVPTNCEEPFSIESFSQSGILYNYKSSSVDLYVDVNDWQSNVNHVILEASQINGETETPLSCIGENSWSVELTNNTSAAPGNYNLKIKAGSSDSGETYLYDIIKITIEGGISQDYPGDAGIGDDPSVIFVEDFEENSLEDMYANWDEAKNQYNISFSDHIPPGSAGSQSFLVTHTGQQDTGSHLYRRMLPGYDQLYIRFYVKFDPDCGPIHHFFHAGGYNPPTPWPQGGAGVKPVGNERFTTGVEPFGNYDPWRWDFYSYWMEMRGSPDEHFWGNDFINDPDLAAEKGIWVCHELMMKMNDPVTSFNGEMALWIDGELWFRDGQCVSYLGEEFPNGGWIWDSWHPDPAGEPFEGFHWRMDEELNLNFLWLLVYITQAEEGHVSRIWYDQVVVATEYIGPIVP